MQHTVELTTVVSASIAKRIAAVRIGFGIIWAADLALKFQPAFYHGVLDIIKSADAGEPAWLNPWFHSWYRFIGAAPGFFAVLVILLETAITLSLIFGIGRRINYIGGAIFSFLIWGVAQGFGGPYVAGSKDIGAGIIYVVVFTLLYFADYIVPPAWSLDSWLERRFPWWHHLSGARRLN